MPGPAITYTAPPVQYTDPLASWPSPFKHVPPEGERCMDGGIAWAVNGGGGTVQVDAAGGNTVNPLSQICALWVDNLACNTDVQFVFADSGHVLTVPGKSAGLYPVNTVRTSFVVNAVSPTLPGDITRFGIYNFLPAPVAVSETNFVTLASISQVPIGDGTTTIVAASKSGIVTAISIGVDNVTGGAAPGEFGFTITDGLSTALAVVLFGVAAAERVPGLIILNPATVQQRFRSGIFLVQAHSGTPVATGNCFVNLYTRLG
jgi:hypothetical protein